MPDHQGLTDEDVALLASLPSIGEPGATLGSAWRDRIRRLRGNQYVVIEGAEVWRSYHADVLLATLDHHTTKAKEDERRRIDGLAESLFSFYYDPSFELNLRAVYDPHPDRPNGATEFFPSDNGFVAALEAATQSTPKGENE